MTRSKLTENHWTWFREFCEYEKLTGGPDPHMKAVIKMCEGKLLLEQLWRIHLYVGFYNTPTAELLWTHFSASDYLLHPEQVETWIDTHWTKLKLRRERRTVKSPPRMAQYLKGFIKVIDAIDVLKHEDFEVIWKFAVGLPHIGRYAASKITECWHLIGAVDQPCPDIRAKGGWSPRAALGMLFPEMFPGYFEEYENDPVSVAKAETIAKELLGTANGGFFNVQLTAFELEVMLCEYKASYSTQRQYPGRSLDSELTYEAALTEHWGPRDTEHMRVRKMLSPAWALGELNGWTGVRDEDDKDLGQVLRRHHYTWSDSLYDFNKTTDLAHPVKRGK